MIIFIILGFVSCIFQLVLVREFTFSIAKNELALIIGVGLWLVFCALSALLRNKKQILSHAGLLIALSLSFSVGVVLTHTLKAAFGIPYYESVSVFFALFSAILILGPTGALSGYAFAQFAGELIRAHPEKKDSLGYLFAYEALGVFLGGIVFTFGFSSYQNPLSFCALPLLFAPVLAASRQEKAAAVIALIAVSLFFTNSFPGLLQKEFLKTTIVSTQGSPYGPLILTDSGRVRSLYKNGNLIATSEDTEANETFIHTAFAAQPAAKKILWLGPCMTSQAHELEKYAPANITAVDINPRPNNLSSFYTPGKNITYEQKDPRAFLARDQNRYDLILLNVPAPSTLLFNRFFTVEFFSEARQHLAPNGKLAFALPSKADILSPAIRDFNACLLHSLGRAFAHTFLIPGDTMIILASEKETLASQLLENFQAHTPRTRYFTAFHLRNMLDDAKRSYITNALKVRTGINKDLVPYGFLYYTVMDQARFTPGVRALPLSLKPVIFTLSLILVGALGFLLLGKRAPWIRLQAGVIGFLAMQASAIVFFMFQLLWGGLFWKLGILIGLFMLGLAAGSFVLSRMIQKTLVTHFHIAGLFLLWFIFFIEMFFWANNRGYTIWFEIVWFVLALESGLLTGLGYPLLAALWRQRNELSDEKIAPALYAADLMGACAGTVLAASLFIPFLGINLMCLVVFGVITVLGLKDWLP